MIDRRQLLLCSAALAAASGAAAQPLPADPAETIDLWPGAPPGAQGPLPREELIERSADPAVHDRVLTNIARPRLALFRPTRPNGAAALIVPGGAYERVAIDKEGYETARWLAARGVTAFVLFYRLPGPSWAAGPDVALSDAQRAMRLIRGRARGLGIDPGRVCAIGFSAGGHVCAELLTRFAATTYAPVDEADTASVRPDAAALIYPVIAMSAPDAHAGSRARLIGAEASPELERAHSPHLNLPADAPPCFLLHAEDDATVPVANTLLMRAALAARGIPAETHIFPDGGHGFGIRLAQARSVARWPDLLFAWGRYRGLWEGVVAEEGLEPPTRGL